MRSSKRNRSAFLCLGMMMCFLLSNRTPNTMAQQTLKNDLHAEIDRLAAEVEADVIAWRRDFHQHPELSNREFRTAEKIAAFLTSLGLDVQTQVAHTGVVGLLRGREEGPVVALRSDMDALPVTEALDLPFASRVKTEYNGQEVGVMHACGHDAHMAMLMGTAHVLSALRDRLPGSVKFIFQPAEEGTPEGEEGGAELMIRQGVLENPRPDVLFGLHVFPWTVGTIAYCAGSAMASVDGLRIVVRGRQTHAAMPWGGVDPIVVASQIVLGLQTIVSRQLDITQAPAVISIGSIHGGVRSNIIPESVEMIGTIRSLNPSMREDIHRRIKHTAERIAESGGAQAEVTIDLGYPVVVNDPELTQQMLPTLQRVVGRENVVPATPKTVAEDVAYYLQEIPGLFFFLGITPQGSDPAKAAMNHSPYFFVDESGLRLGVRALSSLAVDYMLSE
jgi:amidohydrolase